MIKALAIIIIIATSVGVYAEEKAQEKSSKVKLTVTDKAAKKQRSRLGVDQSDFMPSEQQFGFVTSYSMSYDDLQQENPKTLSHMVSLAGTYSFSKATSAYAALAVTHDSEGNRIVRENDTDQYHGISNFNLGLVYTFSPEVMFISRSSNTINLSLPLSERSQIDKHILSASLVNFMTSGSWNKLSLFNRLSANYLWNTYKFSIFDNDTLNRDWLVTESLGVNYQVLRAVGIRVSGQASMVRFLDSTWEMSFGNQFAIFSNISGFQVFASMSNHSYPENNRLDLGYYDKFRRIYSMGVTYAF